MNEVKINFFFNDSYEHSYNFLSFLIQAKHIHGKLVQHINFNLPVFDQTMRKDQDLEQALLGQMH